MKKIKNLVFFSLIALLAIGSSVPASAANEPTDSDWVLVSNYSSDIAMPQASATSSTWSKWGDIDQTYTVANVLVSVAVGKIAGKVVATSATKIDYAAAIVAHIGSNVIPYDYGLKLEGSEYCRVVDASNGIMEWKYVTTYYYGWKSASYKSKCFGTYTTYQTRYQGNSINEDI